MIAIRVSSRCPWCDEELSLRYSRKNGQHFVGCTGYPDCSFTESYDTAYARLASDLRAARSEVAIKNGVIDDLRLQLERARSVTPPPVSASWSRLAPADKLKRLIFEFHPDRNPAGLDANRVVAALNALRDEVR